MSTPQALRSITALLTSDCTLRCGYCYQRTGGSLRMPWPALRTALDVLLASASPDLAVEFSGGEPLLAFDLIRQAVGHVERSRGRRRVAYRLTTNGTVLTAPRLAWLGDHAFEIRLSYHADPGGRGSSGRATFLQLDRLFTDLSGNHRTLWRERLRVAVTAGIPELPTLARTIAYLVQKGVPRIDVAAAFGQKGWRPEDRAMIERQFDDIARLVEQHQRRTGEVPLAAFRSPAPAGPADRRCRGATGRAIAVDPAGQAYGCVMLAGARPVARDPGGTAASAGSSRRPLPFPPHQTSGREDTPVPARPLPALALDPSSPLWAFCLGDVRDPQFAARLASYPLAVAASRVFDRRAAMRSVYAECRTCRLRGTCSVCPVSLALDADAAGDERVSDFVCAFTHAAAAARDRYPRVPSIFDLL